MIKKLLLLLFACSSLACLPISCEASTYTITDQELTQLETNFQTLKQNNQALLTDLTQSKQELLTAKSELTQSQNQLSTLKAQLTALQAESTTAKKELNQAQTQLIQANQSLDKYGKEVKNEINSLKIQRNLLIVGLVYLATK